MDVCLKAYISIFPLNKILSSNPLFYSIVSIVNSLNFILLVKYHKAVTKKKMFNSYT